MTVRYLDASGAATYLGVSRRTFFVHVRRHVPSIKVGARVTFDPVDLDAWVVANKVQPIAPVEAAKLVQPNAPVTSTAVAHLQKSRGPQVQTQTKPAHGAREHLRTLRRARFDQMTYFPLGPFPRDDVEAAAQLLVRYRKANLTGPEFGEMVFRLVNDPDAVVRRAEEIESTERKGSTLRERMQSEAEVPALILPPGEKLPEATFDESWDAHMATVERMKALDPTKAIHVLDLEIYREELAKVQAKKSDNK